MTDQNNYPDILVIMIQQSLTLFVLEAMDGDSHYALFGQLSLLTEQVKLCLGNANYVYNLMRLRKFKRKLTTGRLLKSVNVW
jgi:hypothetical protein